MIGLSFKKSANFYMKKYRIIELNSNVSGNKFLVFKLDKEANFLSFTLNFNKILRKITLIFVITFKKH